MPKMVIRNKEAYGMKIMPLKYLATLPEDCVITSMTQWNGLIYLGTDNGKLLSFDVDTLEFNEIRHDPK